MSSTLQSPIPNRGLELRLTAIHPGWRDFMAREMETRDFQALLKRLREAVDGGVTIYPPAEEIFRVFRGAGPAQSCVVILGQDPYHGPGQAMGLSFSVPDGVRVPPSLKNILKEAGSGSGDSVTNGNLSRWCEQGVFLLNAALTVEAGKAGAHAKWGWHAFTDRVVAEISARSPATVFMLWGKHAEGKAALINAGKHLVLTAPHPSPLSAHRGFLGCGHFEKANAWLTAKGHAPIQW
ncbi:MAG: uracil-DNA glycosylase, partial [Pseudomonadota bacterium]